MSKTLRVTNPFFMMDYDDTFVLTEDGKFYAAEHSEDFHKSDDSNEIDSTYSSTFKISADYAKELINEGYLEEVREKDSKFVNVFDEIDKLINKYQNNLNTIEQDMKDQPQCLKVEKTTVLTNILSVLNHLKTLRK